MKARFDMSRWQLAGWMLALAFPVLALVVDKAASTIFAIFFLAGIGLLIRGRRAGPDPVTRGVLLAFAAYFLVGVASFFLGEQTRLGEQLLGRDLRFLGGVAVFLALARLALPERWLRFSFVAGGFVTGAFAIVEVIAAADADYRAGGETISIVFGHLSAALFAVNLAIALFGKEGRPMAWPVPWLAAGFALAAVTLSSTRGALLAVLAALGAGVLVALLLDRGWRRPGRLAGVVAVLLAAAGIAGWALLPRFADGLAEFRAYMALADSAETRVKRECLGRGALERLVRFSESYGVEVDIVAQRGLSGCADGGAIRLENPSEKAGQWRSPYRNLPEGAGGRVRLLGQAGLKLEGNEKWRKVDAAEPREVELPAVQDVEQTRFFVRVPPGGRVLLVPLVTAPGEYAFAAADTPVGSRLAMWAAALRHVDGSPLGTGAGSWPSIMASEAAANRVPWRLAAYDHPHGDYLTVLVERGWLGLLALFGVLVAPFVWGCRNASPGNWRGPAVILLVVSVAVSALTETVFNHSIGITYYCALVLLLLTARAESFPRN
ncbi:MAG TPA: O-antigen ligase family protein [Gammaproteobacteria bacterium]